MSPALMPKTVARIDYSRRREVAPTPEVEWRSRGRTERPRPVLPVFEVHNSMMKGPGGAAEIGCGTSEMAHYLRYHAAIVALPLRKRQSVIRDVSTPAAEGVTRGTGRSKL